jgi:hypothetical protein
MWLCKGCGRVLSSYALLMVWVHTEQSSVRVDVMCVVYCVIPECVGEYLVVIARWKAWIESVSGCSPQVLGVRSPLVILAPLDLVVAHCSGRLFMGVLMYLSVLLSAWFGCAYVVWMYGVVVGSFGSGCVCGVGILLLGSGGEMSV